MRGSHFLKAVFLEGELSFAKLDMQEFCVGPFHGKEAEVYQAIVSMLDFKEDQSMNDGFLNLDDYWKLDDKKGPITAREKIANKKTKRIR